MTSSPEQSAGIPVVIEQREPAPTREYTYAQVAITLFFILAAAAFTTYLVATRSLEVGTDTQAYAGFFEAMRNGLPETRMEMGFAWFSYLLHLLGLSLTGYQGALFLALLGTVVIGTRNYYRSFPEATRYTTYLCAALMLLFISPMFMQGAINAIRQGLSAMLLLAALLSFQQGRWMRYVMFGLLATGFHTSSLLFLIFAPMLRVRRSFLIAVTAIAFLAYVSGLSTMVIRIAVPPLYAFIMEYTADDVLGSAGVRIDFAVFSLFWYGLIVMAMPLVSQRFRGAIRDGAAVYLVLLLPFFTVGWGYFSNRYLLPAWWTVSLLLAAVLCCSRLPLLRSPLLLCAGLAASCLVFAYYISNNIVV